MITPAKNTIDFTSILEELNSTARKSSPRWLADNQKSGLSRFSKLGLPTVKDEEWKYTNVAPIANKKFHLPKHHALNEAAELDAYIKDSKIAVVYINGVFSKEHSRLSDLSEGLSIVNFADLDKETHKTIQPFLEKYSASDENAFVSLNRAFINQGAIIQIENNTVVKELIHIVHIVSGKEADIVTFPRSLVIAGKSCEAEILESYISFSHQVYFTNAVTDIFQEENSKIRYYKAQGESNASYHVGTTRAFQERDSRFESFSFSTGAELARNDLNIILNGEGAEAILNGLYAATGEQHIDNHTSVDHRPPNCKSNQLYKGILDGNAKAVFNGKIFVKREAQQTNSYQLNKNLLLGAGCQVNTKPQLEIFADDVRCTHGATIGQLDEDELFYLRARAIPKAMAVKMLARGFVDDIFSRINNPAVRNKMDKLLTQAFSLLK